MTIDATARSHISTHRSDGREVWNLRDGLNPTTVATAVEINGEDGEWTIRIGRDGKVQIAEGVDVDEAARKFWDAVERCFPAAFLR